MKAGALLAVLAAAALLGWLYVSMKPEPEPVAPVASTVPSTGTLAVDPAQFGAAAALEFTIAVNAGQVVSGGGVLRVKQGAAVVIRVTSDRADELHLHGYDLELALPAGKPGALAFTADKAGHFDLELHHAHLELGALEVQPK
jgi:hypothetical protein